MNSQSPLIVVGGEFILERARLRGGKFTIKIEGGRVRLNDVEFVASGTALSVGGGGGAGDAAPRPGFAELHDILIDSPRAAALFVSDGKLVGEKIKVRAAEYGLLTAPGATFELDQLEIYDARYAGVGLVGGAGRLGKLLVRGAAPAGGILASDLEVPLLLEDSSIEKVAGVGIQIIRGRGTLNRVSVAEVSHDRAGELGLGLYFQASEIRLDETQIAGTQGGALLAIDSTLVSTQLSIVKVMGHGLEFQRGSKATLEQTSIEGARGFGLYVGEHSEVSFVSGRGSKAGLGFLYADCAGAAKVSLDSESFSKAPPSICVIEK